MAMGEDEELAERLFRSYAAKVLEDVVDKTIRMESFCESPIERLLMVALVCCEYGRYDVHWYGRPDDPSKQNILGPKAFDGVHAYLQPQVGSYRVDFAVIDTESNTRIVIECDGHEFHERTKEQATRDKKRDRDLQLLEFRVLRFTGSEIWKDAEKCAGEVFDALDAGYRINRENQRSASRPGVNGDA